MSLLQSGITKSLAESYEIDNSLRFNYGDGYLRRTFPSAGDQESWTYSCWVKRADPDHQVHMFDTDYSDAANYMNFKLRASHATESKNFTCEVVWVISSTARILATTQKFRDPGAWMHIVLVCDTPDAVAANRLRLYVNGEEVTAFDTDDRSGIGQNDDLPINRAGVHDVGGWNGSGDASGYLAEVYFIDGTALAADSFGELDSTTNQWIPLDSDDVKDAVTFGTNGFYQKYGATELADSFTDSALHQIHTVTAVGDAHTDTSVKKFGTASAQFDDVDSYLSIPDNEDFNLSSGDFTIECWVRFNALTFQPIYSQGLTGSGSAEDHLCFHGSNGLQFINHPTSGGTAIDINQGDITGWVIDTWYHVALTRENTTYYLFRDGIELASLTDASTIENKTSAILIGAINDSSIGNFYDGYIDEYRVSKGIARYVGAFTPSTTAFTSDQYTKLLLHCDGADDGTTFTDSADSAPRHTITANGDVANTRAVRKIGDSSIYFDGTTDWLESPDSSDWQLGDSGTGDFTWESWIYPTETTNEHRWWTQYEDVNNRWSFELYLGKMHFYSVSGGSEVADIKETSVNIVQDVWQHVAFVRDGSDAYFYVNGVSKALTTTVAMGTQPEVSGVLYIGRFSSGSAQMYEGYMDEIRYSNSCRYPDGTTFTPQTTEFTADANTLLLIHSNWDGGLGADSSGNYNTFTPTNLVATDQMIDTPTNNFCTLNPVVASAGASIEGNLIFDPDSSATYSGTGTIGATSGKWYYEFYIFDKTNNGPVGARNDVGLWDTTGGPPGYCEYAPESGGQIYLDGLSTISSVGAFVATDIIGVAVNMDDGEIQWFKNGAVLSGSGNVPITMPATTAAGFVPYTRASGPDKYGVNFGQDSSFAGTVTAQGNQDDNGKGDFYYTPPSGFLALCTDNLSDPEIKLPGENFNTLLWTGDGAASRSITGLGFQADMMWSKIRTEIHQHNLVDRVRGVDQRLLMPNSTGAEDTTCTHGWFDSLDSDGWSMTYAGGGWNVNTDTEDYVGWAWKAGGAPTATNSAGAGATPTAGSVKIDGANLGSALAGDIAANKLSANTTAGFSIVSWTGSGTLDDTVAHGLSVTPSLFIFKAVTGSDNWPVWHESFGIDSNMYLDTASALYDGNQPDRFPTLPTASVFTPGNAANIGGTDLPIITYCFHSVEGYSKVGIYEGNNNADGTFIYLGFKPAFIIYKNIDDAFDWNILDDERNTYNVVTQVLAPDNSAAEITASFGDFTSNGVKMRNTYSGSNNSYTYMYYAVAESPFKYSNAR